LYNDVFCVLYNDVDAQTEDEAMLRAMELSLQDSSQPAAKT